MMTFFKAYALFWKWMLFHKEIKIVHVHGASDASFWRKRIFINIAKMFGKKLFSIVMEQNFKDLQHDTKKLFRKLLLNAIALLHLVIVGRNGLKRQLIIRMLSLSKM